MKALFQRVKRAEVRVEGATVGRIGAGALILLGVERGDTAREAEKLAEKTAKLRVFDDAEGRMNLALGADPQRAFLVVSQFTLCADSSHGNRPSYIAAAPPEQAEPLCQAFVQALRQYGHPVETGRFRAMMDVELVNDGPVTVMLEVRA